MAYHPLIRTTDQSDQVLALYLQPSHAHCEDSRAEKLIRPQGIYTKEIHVTDSVQKLTQGNAGFATHRFEQGLKIIPSLKVFVIGCVDPRVDPGQILGLELGEAAMIRNIGGRITSSVTDELVLLRKLTQAAGGDFNQDWTFVVLQHTDCGILRMQSEPARLAHFFGIDEGTLGDKSVADPHAAVRRDVAALQAADGLPDDMHCIGMVYDVATGLVETVTAGD